MTEEDEINPLILRQSQLPKIVVRRSIAEEFYRDKSPKTIKAYDEALKYFTEYLKVETSWDAIDHLLSLHPGEANMLVVDYKCWLLDVKKLAPNTVNLRLAAIRSTVQAANLGGRINWRLSVKNVKTVVYKDTRGPSVEIFQKFLDAANNQPSRVKAKRDIAILKILFDRGLRCNEIATLNLDHYNKEQKNLQILRKSQVERQIILLSEDTVNAIEEYIALRGKEEGPLFLNLDKAKKNHSRLAAKGIYRIVRNLGEKLGLKSWPHQFRHSAITRVLNQTNGNVVKARLFSGHQNVQTLMKYNDNDESALKDILEDLSEESKKKDDE